MSSSNEVKIALIPEDDYGVTPPAGDFLELPMVSETLTGTPIVVVSQELRSDRQTEGQVATGLELTGDITTELSARTVQRLLIEAVMMSEQVPEETAVLTEVVGFAIKAAPRTNEVDWTIDGGLPADFQVGTVFKPSGGMEGVNEGASHMVTEIDSPTLFSTIASVELVDESANLPISAISITNQAYWEIGTVDRSFSISKEFLDVGVAPNVRSIAYKGERVGSMAMTFNYGEIVSAVFGFGGNGYDTPVLPITDGRTVTPAGSFQKFDASGGMAYVALLDNDETQDVCIEALDFTLNNNLNPQTCVGDLSPSDQVAFSAAVEINTRLYNGVAGFDTLMTKKLSQAPVSIGWQVQDDLGNGYAFYMPRVQLNFPDPAASGRDEFVFLEGAGVASYDAALGNTMRVYQIDAV